jgi:Zn-dependent protease
MFTMRWQMFRLLGIPVSVDLSWLIILALLTLSFAEGFPTILHDYFPGDTGQLAPADYWIMGLVTALAFFTCIVLHEFGHALVARARGMPISGITLFLFGGVSELGEEPKSAATEFLMAVAGPLVSAALAVVFVVVAGIGYRGGWPHPIVIVLGYLATITRWCSSSTWSPPSRWMAAAFCVRACGDSSATCGARRSGLPPLGKPSPGC